MIYLTGDLHGDYSRFKDKAIRKLKKGDTLVVLGDFGFLWNGSKKEKRILKKIGRKRFTVLFLDGAHENFPLLYAYPEEDFSGGKARKIEKNLYHLSRGHVFTLEQLKCFVLGGGESDEKEIRTQSGQWFSQELPSEGELETAKNSLAAHDWQVDVVLTHQCSGTILNFLTKEHGGGNHLTQFLTEIEQKLQFRRWFFGGFHLDKPIPPRHTAVYRKVHPVE